MEKIQSLFYGTGEHFIEYDEYSNIFLNSGQIAHTHKKVFHLHFCILWIGKVRLKKMRIGCFYSSQMLKWVKFDPEQYIRVKKNTAM